NQSGAGDIYLMELGIALSDEGLWENALKIVGDIESDDIRDTLIRIIATDLIHKALVEQALKLVETIEDRWERDQIYKELIKNLLEKGEYERVHEYIGFMENAEIKSITNKEISLSYLKDGKLQRAEDHALKARELAEKSKKDSVKLEILEVVIAIEGKEPALSLVKDMDTLEEKAIGFGIIAAESF
ncbi:MAG: hypothetical protein ACOCTN_04060, partial [Candidatus Natronoplasma sp.]